MNRLVRVQTTGALAPEDYEVLFGESGDSRRGREQVGGFAGTDEPRRGSPAISWAFHHQERLQLDRTEQASILAERLLGLLTQFALVSFIKPHDERVQSLELRVRQCETRLSAVDRFAAVEHSVSLANELRNYLSQVSTAYEAAFAGTRATLAILPVCDAPHGGVQLVIDVLSESPSELSRARAGGARARFVEQLAELLPAPVFGSLDLEFVFPHARQ